MDLRQQEQPAQNPSHEHINLGHQSEAHQSLKNLGDIVNGNIGDEARVLETIQMKQIVEIVSDDLIGDYPGSPKKEEQAEEIVKKVDDIAKQQIRSPKKEEQAEEIVKKVDDIAQQQVLKHEPCENQKNKKQIENQQKVQNCQKDTKNQTNLSQQTRNMERIYQLKMKQILRQFGVDQEQFDDFFQELKINGYSAIQKQYIKKAYRSKFKERFEEIQNQLKQINKEQKQEEIDIKALLINYLQEANIDEDEFQQVIQHFQKGQVSQCILYAKKKYRKSLQQNLNNLIKLKNDQKDDNKVLSLQEQLKKCLIDAGIDDEDLDQCLENIKVMNIKDSLKLLKKAKRQPTQKQITNLLQKYGYQSNTKKQQKKEQKQQNITVKMGINIKKICYNTSQQLKEGISCEFGILDFEEVEIILDTTPIKNHKEFFQNTIDGKVITISQKIQKYYFFNGKGQSIWVSENTTGDRIKEMIYQHIGRRGFTPEDVSIEFQMGSNLYDQIQNLSLDEIKNGKLAKINVENYVKVRAYHQKEEKEYKMKASETIYQLKKKISEDLLPLQAQSIFYQNNGRILLKECDYDKNLRDFIGAQKKTWDIQLQDTHTVQFYGFHQNRVQKYDHFSEFFVESEQQIKEVIENSNFRDKSLENLFFEKFIKYVFSGIKKRFPIQTTIQKFKEMTVSLKSQNLWMPFEEDKPITMNQYFVLTYLLYNSEQKLRIALMKLLRPLLPMPMYFYSFKNILNISENCDKNKELIWILKEGVTITSFGLHNQQKIKQEKGKSTLINQIFYTNFARSESKHKINTKIPFISVSIYEELFPLNIIDLSSDCPTHISEQVLKCSNIVILHSWLSKQDSLKKKKQIERSYGIIVILIIRDANITGQQSLKHLKQNLLIKNQMIYIPNMKNKQKVKSQIDLIRGQFNELLIKNRKYLQSQSQKILSFSQDKILKQLTNSINKLTKQTNEQLLLFTPYRTKDITQVKIKTLLERGLNLIIPQLLSNMCQENYTSQICLDFFRQKLREYQNEKISKFMRIYKLKSELAELDQMSDDKKIFSNKVHQIHQNLKNMPEIYQPKLYIIDKTIQQVHSNFDQITSQFENIVRPSIFSIELFWRQIYAYLEIAKQKQDKSDYTRILDMVINLKSKQIMDSQPFELIDGDSLKMPKEIIHQVFKPINDRCLVVTILGPQSSGKSTLLNFLFGCDFATSEGRCTRGVYGTFFKVKQSQITNFDGIFVIDTEGLFALTNEKDAKQEHRQDFDSKLVLFCLAVSDIVIINVRGNLDLNTERMMRICYEKLEALGKSEETKPQIIIVLNQNSTSKTQESENEFKKIRKTFNFKIAKSLSLAYVIKNLGKEDISLFTNNQILTKKTPLPHFRKETTSLLKDMVNTMKYKKTAEKMVQKVQKFQRIWTTVQQFPNLSKMNTKQYSQLETQIREWKKGYDQKMGDKYRKIIENVKNQIFDQKKAENQLQELNGKYLQAYKKQFYPKKCGKQLTALVMSEQNSINHAHTNSIMKLKYQIIQIDLKKQMNRQKFEGDYQLRQVQNQIIRNQNKNIKTYTNQQKQELFENCFSKALKKIEKSMRLSQKTKSQQQRIRNEYEHLINVNKSSMQGYGLLKERFKISQQNWINENNQTIFQKLEKTYLQPSKPQQFMEHTQKPHTNILKGGQIDAKLRYLNIMDYYKFEQKYNYLYLTKAHIQTCFDPQTYMKVFQQIIQQYKQQTGQIKRLKQMYDDINQILMTCKIKIQSFYTFRKVYESKNKSLFQKLINYIFVQNQTLKVDKKQNYYRYNNKQYTTMIGNFNMKSHQIIQKPPTQFFKYQYDTYHRQNRYILKFGYKLDKIVEQMIDWNKIATYCKENKGYQQKQKKNKLLKIQDQKMRKQINLDLNKLGLQVYQSFSIIDMMQRNLKNNHSQGRCYRTGSAFFKQLYQSIHCIQEGGSVITQKEYQIIQRNIGSLRYFNGRKLMQGIRYSGQKFKLTPEKLVIGIMSEKILKPIREEFNLYNQSNALNLQKQFKSKSFQNFIFDELTKKGAIKRFAKQIFRIVDDILNKWGKFESKAISELYKLVNAQITLFNDDLNQVSYQLSPKMMGKVHLIAIYIMWKYETNIIQKKQTQLYNKKLESRDDELKKFMMRTSNDINQQIEQEVQTFQQKLCQFFKENVDDLKSDIFYEKQKQFNNIYDRPRIQGEIDMDIFQNDTDPQIILQYLQKPAQFISKKYEEKYSQAWENLKRTFYKSDLSKIIFDDIENIMNQFNKNLQDIDKINETKGTARDLFEMIGQAAQSDYDQQAKKIMFAYFLDLLLNDNPNKQRKCADLILKAKNQITKLPKLKKQTHNLLQKLSFENLTMTNMPKFIEKFIISDSLEKLKQALSKVYSFNQEEQRNFINDIRTVICNQKCPCCGRICGVEKVHTFHKCQYGHQMRALAGNYITNSQGKKQAFVVRCDQLEQTDIMDYNGNKYTWTQFKDYWSNKPVGGWQYDDTKKQLSAQDKKRFENAWFRAGPIFCQKQGIQYVHYTDSSRQKKGLLQKAHFIFALDESYSMSGDSWNQLMKALQRTLDQIKAWVVKGGTAYITVINFNDSYRVIYNRKNVNDVRLDNIQYGGGGTTFGPVFDMAANITAANIKNQTVIFIFMTDGGAQYPQNGINHFKQIIDSNPKKFIYSGIQFESDTQMMKNISMALGGKNIVANNFDQLLEAYQSAIQVIAYRQQPAQSGIMEIN